MQELQIFKNEKFGVGRFEKNEKDKLYINDEVYKKVEGGTE